MEMTISQLIGIPVEAREGVAGKLDDLFFDVRTGDITHASVALTGWYRGNVVVVPVDGCNVSYADQKLKFRQMSRKEIRGAPLLDEEAERNLETAQFVTVYEDTVPYWNFGGRANVTTTRSESIEQRTGQPALWGIGDLIKGEIRIGKDVTGGHIKDVFLDVRTWKATHALFRKGTWYRSEIFMIPMSSVVEIERSERSVRLITNLDALGRAA